jgi:predicted helicase
MKHLLKGNLALMTCRQIAQSPWQHTFITESIADYSCISTKTRERTYVFPLYLYLDAEPKQKRGFHGTMMLFEPEEEYDAGGRKPNIAPKVFEMLEAAYGQKPAPEQILYYCYAVLYSPAYREKYAEFLKIDFPRIPFTADHSLFLKMAEKGEALAQLHLLKSKKLNNPIAKYWGLGDDKIEKPVYDEKNQSVFINKTKYFSRITPEVWNYHIGGYQVMEKYLKDRKGRQMTDPAVYCKIATALAETIRSQQELNEVFAGVEQNYFK